MEVEAEDDQDSIHDDFKNKNGNSDDVIYEIPIMLMPINGGTFNRLQFQTREAAEMENCTAKFKQNVKHLQIVLQHEEVEQEESYHDYFHDDEDEKIMSDHATYQGEGFSQHGIINNSVGFIKNGKLFLAPIHDIYDMQHLMPDKKNEASQSKIEESRLEEKETEIVAAPVRIKFGRAESDFKKKKREQSSQHKQKLIDEDPWLPLNVERRKPIEFLDPSSETAANGADTKIKIEHP